MIGEGILNGLMIVLSHVRQKPITQQYPEQPAEVQGRFRGYDFGWSEERCTGCATCAKACPHGCIDIVTHPLQSGRYSIDVFDIDVGKCMVCGLCVEVCPYDALFMGTRFALATERRWDLVQHKQDIGGRPELSAYYRPPFQNQMAPRAELQDDYGASRGVTKPAPPVEEKKA